METQTQKQVQRRAVIGTLRDKNETTELRDPFAEAPFFAAGESNSEHINSLKEGDTIAAVFHGLRQSKVGKKSWYARLEADNGDKIRLFTPANLKGQLMSKDTGDYRVPVGTYVEITYLGMESVEGINDGDPIHQFELRVGKEAIN